MLVRNAAIVRVHKILRLQHPTTRRRSAIAREHRQIDT
jgi:hypothetical protein